MTIFEETDGLAAQLLNCRHYWLGYGREERTDDDVSLYRSGVRHGQLNGILRVAEGGLSEALARSKGFGELPWMWWVGPDSYPGLAEDLLVVGASEVARLPVMTAHIDKLTEPALPAGLTIEQVTDLGALDAWIGAYAGPMGVSADQTSATRLMEGAHPQAPKHLVRFAGRLDGRVVATSALLDSDGVAGIYVVATEERYRGRGIGTALTWAAIAEGRRRGMLVTTLQASPMGRTVYERLGLRTVAEYRLFRPA